MKAGKETQLALGPLLVSSLAMFAVSCETDFGFHPEVVLFVTRTLPIETLETGVEDYFTVWTTPNAGRFDATWSRGRWFLAEAERCGVRNHMRRSVEISTNELEQATAGLLALTEFTYTQVDRSAHPRLGCLPVGRNSRHLVDGPNVFAEWVGDIPPHPVTVEILEPLGRLWNRVIREGETPSQENRRDVPIPAEEEGLWPQPEWSLGM